MWFSPNFHLLDLFSPDVTDLDVLALSTMDAADLVPDLERRDVADLNVPDLGSPYVVDCKSERHGYSSVLTNITKQFFFHLRVAIKF